MENRNRKRGFTLIEIVTAMLVMAVIAGAGMMSITSAKQTAKREAERVQAYIYRKMQKADRMHKDFTLELSGTYIYTNWNDEANKEKDYQASAGCTYEHNFEGHSCHYTFNNRRFEWPGTITVNGADGNTYYVYIAGSTEGRVRISDKKLGK